MSQTFNWQYFQQDYGVAAAYAVLVMAVSLAATLVYLRALRDKSARKPMSAATDEPEARACSWPASATLCAWMLVPIYLIALGAIGGATP